MLMLNGKDSFWLQLEVCREYQRSRCTRPDEECKFAHPPTNVEVQSNGRVTACYDSIKGRCQRETCKYMHPPAHLKDQLLINGRNHLALKNAILQQHQQRQHHNHTQHSNFHHQDPLNQHLTLSNHNRLHHFSTAPHHSNPRYDPLSMQAAANPAAAMAAAIAATSMNSFMDPAAFSHSYNAVAAASPYAAAAAVAAAAAQHQKQQQQQQQPALMPNGSADRLLGTPKPDLGARKLSASPSPSVSPSTLVSGGQSQSQFISLPGGPKRDSLSVLKTPLSPHYPTPAQLAAAAAAAAAHVAAVSTPVTSAVAGDQLTYYMTNPAAVAAAAAAMLSGSGAPPLPTAQSQAQPLHASILPSLYTTAAAMSNQMRCSSLSSYLVNQGNHKTAPKKQKQQQMKTQSASCDTSEEEASELGQKEIGEHSELTQNGASSRNDNSDDKNLSCTTTEGRRADAKRSVGADGSEDVDNYEPDDSSLPETKRLHLDTESSRSSLHDDQATSDESNARANAATSFKPNSAIATRSENRSWMPAKRSEVCRDFLRNSCRRDENSCRFIHLALTDLEARGHQQEWQELGQQAHKVRSMNNGAQVLRISGSNGCEERKVEVCIDFMKGRCQRSGQKCRYLHPECPDRERKLTGASIPEEAQNLANS